MDFEAFISYSKHDREICEKILNEIENQGIPCWYAPRDAHTGVNYGNEIPIEIKRRKIFFLIISKDSCVSNQVANEVELATSYNKTIIPIRVDDCQLSNWMEYHIKSHTWIYVDETNLQERIEELVLKVQEHDAFDNYTDITPDNAPRNITSTANIQYSKLGSLYKIPAEELESIKARYVPVKERQVAAEILSKHHLLYLKSSKRVGKYTTSLHILNELNLSQINQIIGDTTFDLLATSRLKKDTGYLIDNVALDMLVSANHQTVRLLMKNLEENNSYLILTSSNTTDYNESLDPVSITIEDAPDRYQLVKKQIETATEDTKTSALQFIHTNKQMLEQSEFAPAKVEQLATFILQTKGLTSAQLNDYIAQLTQERIRHYFNNDITRSQFSKLLTLAVLRDIPLLEFSKHAQHVSEQINIGREDTSLQTLEAELEFLQARTYKKPITTDIGMDTVEFITFTNKDNADLILRHMWQHYPDLRKTIVEWIHLLIEDKTFKLKEEVIQTVVYLATLDFSYIRNELLQGWANHKSPYYRYSAVKVLKLLSYDRQYIAQISRLLHSWGSLRNNYNLRWTAAATYTSRVGAILLPQAMGDIIAMYHDPNLTKMNDTIARSISFLLSNPNANTAYYEIIFKKLLYAVAKYKGLERIKATEFFINVIEDSTLKASVLLRDKEVRRNWIIPLLAEGLRNRLTKQKTITLLEDWFIQLGVKDMHVTAELIVFEILQMDRSLGETLYKFLEKVALNPNCSFVEKIIENMKALEGSL
ncbi:toll/interleukin-1 receptor domain-containing protein [Pseudalkalibacillus sp. SCS-8]|uniref:toll/interleukin-1 receptor domain-containing protein n=1 Tax=Pseudalkalibacillus nanhaiensis TaxID=3115291 RepID=UPI0032DA692A